jgi:hypothetical protein
MEDWQFDFEWGKIRHHIKKRFNKETLPDLNAILFLVGHTGIGALENRVYERRKTGFDAHRCVSIAQL